MLSPSTLKTVVVPLVLSRLDYANSVVTGLCPHTWWNVCSQCSLLRLVWSTDSAIRPSLWSFNIAAWAEHSRAYPIQIGGRGPPSSTRQRPRLPLTFHWAVRRSKLVITAFCIISSSTHPFQFVAWLLVQGRFRCLGQLFGTVCQLTLRLSTFCHFVDVSTIISSCTRIQAPLNNYFFFYHGLEVFYIALGHVNLIRNYYY